MQLQLAFELRSPGCGAPHRELYAAMLDICAWADELGFDVVNFGEHHGADSGYNPSPLIACAAVADCPKKTFAKRCAKCASPCSKPTWRCLWCRH